MIGLFDLSIFDKGLAMFAPVFGLEAYQQAVIHDPGCSGAR